MTPHHICPSQTDGSMKNPELRPSSCELHVSLEVPSRFYKLTLSHVLEPAAGWGLRYTSPSAWFAAETRDNWLLKNLQQALSYSFIDGKGWLSKAIIVAQIAYTSNGWYTYIYLIWTPVCNALALFFTKRIHCVSALIGRACVTLCSVRIIMRFFLRSMLLILLCHCFESVAQHPVCAPEFGWDINIDDCQSAFREYIRNGPILHPQTEVATLSDFYNPRCSITGRHMKHFPPRHEVSGSCLLTAEMEANCIVTVASWRGIIYTMELLFKTCVGFHGGIGGELKLGNFIFQVRHSSCIIDSSTSPAPNPSSPRAHASGQARPAANTPLSRPLSTKIHPASPSAASTSSQLASTGLPGGSFAALHAAALHGYGYGGIPTIDGFPSQPHSGPSVPAAGSSAPQLQLQSAAGTPNVLFPAERYSHHLPPVRFPTPAAAQQVAAANPVQAPVSLLPGTAGARPVALPAYLQWRPPPPTELTAPAALPQNPPAAPQQSATTEGTAANILAGMQEASDGRPFLPPVKRLRSSRAGDQAKRPPSRRWASPLLRIKRP